MKISHRYFAVAALGILTSLVISSIFFDQTIDHTATDDAASDTTSEVITPVVTDNSSIDSAVTSSISASSSDSTPVVLTPPVTTTSAPAEVVVPPQKPHPLLQNRLWIWETVQTKDGETIKAPTDATYYVSFDTEGSWIVQADCNRKGGDYEVVGSELRIDDDYDTTNAECPKESQEEQFTQLVVSAVGYTLIASSTLELILADNAVMTFRPVLTSKTELLRLQNDNTWAWEKTITATGTTIVPASILEGFSISFSTDNDLNVYAGCNDISATYDIEGNQISFGPFRMTRMFCEDSKEATFVDWLESVDTYTLDEQGRLSLSSDDMTLLFE